MTVLSIAWLLLCILQISLTFQISPTQVPVGPQINTIYQLRLNLQYPQASPPTHFNGHLIFDFKSTHDNEFVLLEASNLSLITLKIFNRQGNSIIVSSVEQTSNQWKVRIADIFWSNQVYRFEVNYKGRIDQQNGGFFATNYIGKNGEKRYILSSNVNGNFATVMPFLSNTSTGSIDLSVNVPTAYTAVFNSIELSANKDVNNPLTQIISFKRTPQMSFNNFLLIIGDLAMKSQHSKSGLLVRSFIPRDFDDFLEETSHVATNCLSATESYFEQLFDIDKIDHINALGNWSFFGHGINVYPADSFGIWSNSPASDILNQKLMICKQTIRSLLNGKEKLNKTQDLSEALNLLLSYRLVAEFEDADYASVVNEEMARISSTNQTNSNIRNIYDYSKHTSNELAAILLMANDALGDSIFDQAMIMFVQMIQEQQTDNVFPLLIEAFQRATDYTPLCGTMMVKDFLNSWFSHSGPANIRVSIQNGDYLIQQMNSPRRIVPLVIKELGGKRLPTQWLLPSGAICSQQLKIQLDLRIPYTFNSNGKTYTQIEYSDEVHELYIVDGVWQLESGAQYVYIRDLGEQAKKRPEKLHNLFEFIVHSFVDTQPSKGSPLFVDEALRQLAFYYKTEPTKINDINKRQIQNLHNSIYWQPNKETLRNSLLSNQILRQSVINQVAGSRLIAKNLYTQFVDKCAPNFECHIFPVEILSAVLCGSVIDKDDDNARKLLTQMINDLHQRHNLVLFNSANKILNDAWQCVY